MPASSSSFFAASTFGSPYFSWKASIWPGKPGGTIEYSGETVFSYAFEAIWSRSISWATAWRVARSLPTGLSTSQTK